MPDLQNEPDEVILAPVEFFVTGVDAQNGKIWMSCRGALNSPIYA